jgi:hypothetical protein
MPRASRSWQGPPNVTTLSPAASTLPCMCGVYRLELLQNKRQFPDSSVIEWIVQIRCKTDQTRFAEHVESIAPCFFLLSWIFSESSLGLILLIGFITGRGCINKSALAVSPAVRLVKTPR